MEYRVKRKRNQAINPNLDFIRRNNIKMDTNGPIAPISAATASSKPATTSTTVITPSDTFEDAIQVVTNALEGLQQLARSI